MRTSVFGAYGFVGLGFKGAASFALRHDSHSLQVMVGSPAYLEVV